MVVSIQAGRFIKEVCTKGPNEGNNDINHLALHKKRTKYACNPSMFQKEPNDIMGCYFQSKPPGK
jgi:hypothetical protein